MKLSSLRYLIKEGFRNLWQNRFMGITSIGVLVSCLILTGGAFLVFANVEEIFKWAYEENIAMAWMDEGATSEQLSEVKIKIESLSNVAHVEIYSKEQQLKDYEENLPQSINERFAEGENPYLDGLKVSFKDLGQYGASVKLVENIKGVESVDSASDLAETLVKLKNMVFIIGGGIVGLLLLVSLFIISNTIKLTVYNRRLEVSIMKSVGATNSFVRLPFVIEGMLLGVLSAGAAYGLIYLVYGAISRSIMDSNSTFFMFQSLVGFGKVSHILLAGFLLIGSITGMLGSAISISKYLKKEGGISSVI